VPSFGIDGVMGGGGGGRSATKSIYNRILPDIEKAMEVAAGADLKLEASTIGGAVKVKATPAGFNADGEAVKLQILLVEEMLSYSGENGVRFHPMVVRGIGGANYGGFTVDLKAPATIDHVFDLAQISTEHKAHLDDYEVNGRHGAITFSASRLRSMPATCRSSRSCRREEQERSCRRPICVCEARRRRALGVVRRKGKGEG
jgi:hypothetical protein